MDTQVVIGLVTVVVTLALGILSKKHPKINNKLIPIQNLAIGLIVATIEFIITKDFNVAVAVSGIFAGGLYDIPNCLRKIFNEED